MTSYIKKLQSKPEAVRKQILLASIITSMAVVVFIWVYGLQDHFSNQTVAKNEDGLKPFTLFANSISSTYDNISASVGKISSKKDTSDAKEQKQIDLIVVDHPAQQ